MATKVKPCRLQVTGTPQVGNVPVYVDEDTFQWGAGGSGDVVGPASSTDGHLAVFDGATGKLIKDGGAIPTGDVGVSTDTGTLLSAGVDLWLGTETDFSSISTPDTNTLYIQYKSDGGGGWQPGANTMLYLPMETDLLDHSGNSLTVNNLGSVALTNVGLSFSVAQFNSTSTELTFDYQGNINNAWTMSFWENITNQNTDAMFIGAGTWSAHNLFQIGFTPRPVRGLTLSDISTDINSGSYTGRDGSWHLITATYSGVGGQTNNAKIYIDGVLVAQGTMQGWNWNTNTFMVGNYNQGTSMGGFLSKLIIETAERTAQEVADYFDLTKGDYGIS